MGIFHWTHRLGLLGCLFLGSLAGCASTGTPPAEQPTQKNVAPAPELRPEEFARVAHQVLASSPQDDPAKQRLASVVQFQLRRAEELFSQGHHEAALAVGHGALLLLQKEDAVDAALAQRTGALLPLAHAAARTGDIGRARALYQLTLEFTGDSHLRTTVEQHLENLREFSRATQAPTALLRAGEQADQDLSAAWVNPRQEIYQTAQKSILAWMQLALTQDLPEGGPSTRLERDEAIEAYRAMRSGVPALIALGLRQGEPLAPLAILDAAELSQAIAPGVRLRLEAAGTAGSTEAYLDLFRLFDSVRRETESEANLPPLISEGASFWTTVELYRASPGHLQHAMPLAMSLLDVGMPEVASVILAQNVHRTSAPEALAWSISLLLKGMLELNETNQLAAARQSFLEAAPLLELADEPRFQGIRPEPARVYSLLAALEIRSAHLDRALPLLQQAVERLPSADLLLRLAHVYRQQGNTTAAREVLHQAITAAGQAGDLLQEGMAEEFLFQLERAEGKQTEAAAALRRALERALTVRALDLSVVSEAAVERFVARLSEHYGNSRAVRRAYDRARVASRSTPSELEITLIDMSRSALTTGDVHLARAATRAAYDSNLSPDQSVYIALWQKLTERRKQTPSDGLATELLSQTTQVSGWIASLRQYGLGQLSVTELLDAAQTLPERTEAEFYQALAESSEKQGGELLRKVAESPALDLIEVKMARDWNHADQPFPLPSDLTLP